MNKKVIWFSGLTIFFLLACNVLAGFATPESVGTLTPLPEQPGSFEYASVAEALSDLKSRQDVSVDVSQGWTIVTELDGLTTWSFTPSDHPAHPAVAKRTFYEDQNGWQVEMSIRCEAEKAACDQFVRDFEALNEQMREYIEQQNRP